MGCLPEHPEGWWRDPKLFAQEYEAHGSVNSMADAHQLAESALRKWRDRHGLPVRVPPRAASRPLRVVEAPDDDGWLLDSVRKLGDAATVERIADHAERLPREVRAAQARLAEKGYRVEVDDSRIVLHRVPPPSENIHPILFDGDTYRFAVISDTHLGSKHQKLAELRTAYEVIAAEGIDTVYHPGDLVCGSGIYRGQINDIFLHTYEDQVEYAVENYPRVDGITTHIICGNHDAEGEFGRVGANPVVAVCNQRPDMIYGGDFRASYEFAQGTRLYMVHPKGGKGYALSYKMQKFAESFEGGSKPNVCLVGHYHSAGWFMSRSIQILYAGCFEGGGGLGYRVPLGEPAVGFYIVELTVADDGSVVRFLPRWHPFYAGRAVAA